MSRFMRLIGKRKHEHEWSPWVSCPGCGAGPQIVGQTCRGCGFFLDPDIRICKCGTVRNLRTGEEAHR